MRKLRKLIKTPGLFFRDYFNNRYPVINSEQLCPENYESVLIQQIESLERIFTDSKQPLPVDVVYTWINKNDQWKHEFNKAMQNDVENELGHYSTDAARFEDHNELYYSIKSVRRFMPWVRRIFIVTNNRVDLPEYLQKTDIEVVLHSEIIRPEYLPTFNSHVIEAHLHKIPDLSENFIYFNDDVFVARPLSRTHFFQDNGLASLFVAHKYLDQLFHRGKHTPTLLASLSSQKLLKRYFENSPNQMLVHTYVPLKKSCFKSAWDRYEIEIKGFLNNRFRSDSDLNLATFLVPWLMFLQAKSTSHLETCYYFNIRSVLV